MQISFDKKRIKTINKEFLLTINSMDISKTLKSVVLNTTLLSNLVIQPTKQSSSTTLKMIDDYLTVFTLL